MSNGVMRAWDGTAWQTLPAAAPAPDAITQAVNINFSPAGTIAASNVQAALEEVSSDVTAAIAGYTAADALKVSSSTLAASSGANIVGYLPGGTDPLAVSVQTKLRRYVDVKDFGAVGNGIADDTQAIQNAINHFGTDGGTIFFPPGVYGISGSGLVLPDLIPPIRYSGLTLLGSGRGTNLKKLAGAGNILKINGGFATVSQLTFDGNNVAATGIGLETGWDGRVTVIENCSFLSCAAGGQGIFNVAGDAYVVRNCYFINCGNWAIESLTNFMNSSISGNYMQGSGGIHFISTGVQAEGVRIIDNTIMPSGGSGYGIDIEYGLEIIVANNIIDQILAGGMRIRNNASYVKVLGNWFGGGTEAQISITQFANSLVITGNTFEGGGGGQLVANAANLGDINTLTIQNNIHNNIAAAGQGIILLKVKRASVCGNVMPGAEGGDSIYWGGGSVGIIANNALWKAPATDGSASVVNNVIG